MRRSLGALGLLLVSLWLTPSRARAQRVGDYNAGRLLSGVSAAALGQPVGVSLGIYSQSLGYGGPLAVGDFAVGPGALRLVAAHPRQFEGYRLGYAAVLAHGAPMPFVRTTAGAELSFGYVGYRLRGTAYIGNGTYMDAHVSFPLGVAVGTGSRVSFAPYVAPYAEIGAAPSGYWTNPSSGQAAPSACADITSCKYLYTGHHRSEGLGAAIGFRLSAWRLAIDAAYGDLPFGQHRLATYPMSLGVSVRF